MKTLNEIKQTAGVVILDEGKNRENVYFLPQNGMTTGSRLLYHGAVIVRNGTNYAKQKKYSGMMTNALYSISRPHH